MVRISFGKKLACSQWGSQASTHGALLFFVLSFKEGAKVFFSIFLGSPFVPTISPLSSNGFPSGSQYVPQHVLHSTSPLSRMLWQILFSFHLYIGPKGRNSILQNRTSYFGEALQFHFF